MRAIVLLFTLANLAFMSSVPLLSVDKPVSDTDITDTELFQDKNETWKLIETHCTLCHSTKLIQQHQLSSDQWLKSIRRMQQDEGLWDLGENEARIVEYLNENYGVTSERKANLLRRKPLNQPPIDQPKSDSEEQRTEDVSTQPEDDNQ